MEFIIVFDADSKRHSILESSSEFIEKFASYEDAKSEAEVWKNDGDCRSYSIYALCSDERNHVI